MPCIITTRAGATVGTSEDYPSLTTHPESHYVIVDPHDVSAVGDKALFTRLPQVKRVSVPWHAVDGITYLDSESVTYK